MKTRVIIDFATIVILILISVFVLPRVIKYVLPFIIGYLIAVIASPLVRFMEKNLKIKRKYASVLLIILVISIMTLSSLTLIMVAYKQILEMYNSMPMLFDNKAGSNIIKSFNIVKSIDIVKAIAKISIFTLFTIIAAYFFIIDKEIIEKKCKDIFPSCVRDRYQRLSKSFKDAVGGYFLAQFKIMFVMIGIMWLAFIVLQIKMNLLIAIIIGIADFLPIIGAGMILIPWAIYEIYSKHIYVGVGLGIVYLLCAVVKQVIEPKMVGNSLGISSLASLFLLYIGFCFGGIVGIVLAIPVGVIIGKLWNSGFFIEYLEDIAYLFDKYEQYRKK